MEIERTSRLFLFDGEEVPAEASRELSEGIQLATVLPDGGCAAFTKRDLAIDWYRQKGSDYRLPEEFDLRVAVERGEELSEMRSRGGDELSQELERLRDSLLEAETAAWNAGCALGVLEPRESDSRPADRVPAYEDLQVNRGLETMRRLVSPKMGTAQLYRHANYHGNFMFWNGIFHISSHYVGASNNDCLSSAFVGGAGLVLCEHAWFGGRWVHMGGAFWVRDFAASQWSWFNDKMSSFFFYA